MHFLLAVSLAAPAAAADLRPDDIFRISYRIGLPSQPPIERPFKDVNPGYQPARVGTRLDGAGNLQTVAQSQQFRALVAQTRSDVDGNRFLSATEMTRSIRTAAVAGAGDTSLS